MAIDLAETGKIDSAMLAKTANNLDFIKNMANAMNSDARFIKLDDFKSAK